jgi:hypothetical protein
MPSKPSLLGVAEYDVAGLGNMLVQLHGPGGFADQCAERALAILQRRPAQVFAAKLKQIESEEHGLGLRLAAVAQAVEHGNAILAADHHLAIDQAGAAGERGNGGSYGRIAVSPIDSTAGQEPHASSIAARQQSEAVQLYLVNPSRPGWGLGRRAGEAGFDEAIWPGTHTQ